ncbi:MAG: SRPBCC family protein, partial [Solirubrobacterales bacterium]
MGKVDANVEIAAPLAEVWDLYFERSRWASWVDGLAAVVAESGYPEEGGTLTWRSTPAGRGEVRERVLAHEPRSVHRISYEDPQSAGRLEVSFEMLPAESA